MVEFLQNIEPIYIYLLLIGVVTDWLIDLTPWAVKRIRGGPAAPRFCWRYWLADNVFVSLIGVLLALAVLALLCNVPDLKGHFDTYGLGFTAFVLGFISDVLSKALKGLKLRAHKLLGIGTGKPKGSGGDDDKNSAPTTT